MKFSYKKRILTYFLSVFITFSVIIILCEQEEEKDQRLYYMENSLNNYTSFIHSYIVQNNLYSDSTLHQLLPITSAMPMRLRISIINKEGKVMFDNRLSKAGSLENHLSRPEIRSASYQSKGTNIRQSSTTNREYIYFARSYENYYVRVALPYEEEARSILTNDYWFIYVVLSLLLAIVILGYFVSDRFSKSIIKLKVLAKRIEEDRPLPEKITFPKDELGEIGGHLLAMIKQKERHRRILELERDKLIEHFSHSQEGICFFDKNRVRLYTNTHFYQYFSFIVDQPVFDLDHITEEEEFKAIFDFIERRHKNDNFYSYRIVTNGRAFLVQTIVFEDDSFEITMKDITEVEKNRQLKQEITSNIAHELRTPVTSLRGYLETLDAQSLNPDRQAKFITRAYQQSIRLSNLIEDISLISKIEEASQHFDLEKVNLSHLLNDLRIDMSVKLSGNNINLNIQVRDNLEIKGNYTLLYSIFRNLLDNSISYAGPDIEVGIVNYMEDDEHLYFTYYDTGKGVKEEYLGRLFERFYRVSEGRTRNSGGSGLGLSIVKNAVLFHKGDIHVKNRTGGGLEFLFSLKK